MKITHNKVGNNLNTTDSKIDKSGKVKSSAIGELADTKSSTGSKATGKIDLGANTDASKVSVSSRAQDMKKAKEIAKNTPDIREDRVAELQKAIDNGTYKVAAKDIADKMVDEELMWVE